MRLLRCRSSTAKRKRRPDLQRMASLLQRMVSQRVNQPHRLRSSLPALQHVEAQFGDLSDAMFSLHLKQHPNTFRGQGRRSL